jgi:signal transduction histidine kinase
MTFKRPAAWIWLFVAFTAIGVFFGLHSYLDDVTWHRTGTLNRRLLEELSGSYSAMVLVPLMGVLASRYPFARGRIWRAVAANVAGLALYTLLHTTINAAMRYAFAPLAGLPGYDYGNMFFRYPMEAASDIVYYSLMMSSIYLIEHFLATQELRTKLVRAELENLRLQLQPHFLFNTLNAISAVMYEDVAKADRMLSQVSDFMRCVLESGGVEEVTLDDELRIERMYVDIMKTRLERNLDLEVRIDDDSKRAAVPFMVLQPLLENSIRHGMGSARTAIALSIAAEHRNGSTVITVSDDGLGIDPAHSRGIGLSNVASRLSHLYGRAASFDIRCAESGGTIATLVLPYRAGGGA